LLVFWSFLNYLSCTAKECVALSLIVDLELINSVDVWNDEFGLVLPTHLFQVNSNEWINSYKFELNVLCRVALPDSVLEFFNDNGVDYIFRHNVRSGSMTFPGLVMSYIAESKNAFLLEHPLTESSGEVRISGLVTGFSTLVINSSDKYFSIFPQIHANQEIPYHVSY